MIDLLAELSRLISEEPDQQRLAKAIKRLHFLTIATQMGLWGTYWADSLLHFFPTTLISSGESGAAADLIGIIAPLHLGGYIMAVNMKTLLKPLIDAARAEERAKGRAETEAKYQNYLDRLRQAGVNIPDEIPLDPPVNGNNPGETETLP